MKNIDTLIENYYSWLKSETEWKNIDEWIEITSPYLDRNNDYIQIYLKKEGTNYLLTDDGETIGGLKEEGCNLNSSKRQQLLQLTLRGYGVKEESGQLQIKIASIDNFPICKHSLVQAILAVNDMFYTASPHVASLFLEDVKQWLEDSKIRYSERVSFTGLSNYTRSFDFLIPKSSKQPERLIKTINNPIKNSADSIIMDWLDTKDMRPQESKLYAFINDKKSISKLNVKNNIGLDSQSAIGKVSDAIKQYKIEPILWSKKHKIKNELVA